MYHSVKTKRTLFTEEKIANLRKNIGKFDWAKEKAAEILKKADWYLAFGTDRIAFDVANETLKRSCSVNQKYGCPHCGTEMLNYGDYGWLIDVEKYPWKIKCPNCGRLYPSNDFEAFYRSGQDEHGDFSYDRADRSLLVNELYPEMGPDFAVDDGTGWLKDPNEVRFGRYCLVPFYVFVGMWMYGRPMEGNYVRNAIEALANAYLVTGDKKYGYPAAVLLTKMAYLYPRMDALDNPWDDGYTMSHGLTGLGRFIGSIWDAQLVSLVTEWYDMLFPCIDDDLAAYFRENPVRYFGEAPQSGADIIACIEEKMFLQVFPDLQAVKLNCNPGPAQAMIMKTAVVLDRADLYDEYAEYIFKYIDREHSWQSRYDLESLFISEVTRDGFASEGAIGYNHMWPNGFMEAAQYLKGSKYDLFKNVKFAKLGKMTQNYVILDKNSLDTGDSGTCGSMGLYVSPVTQTQYFLAGRDPRDAALLVAGLGDKPICTDWYLDCEAVEREIREAAAKYGPFRSESRCMSGGGIAVLESRPEGKDAEAVTLWCGQNFGHSHRDTLNLGVYGFGISLMPDHGYPDFANTNPRRMRWTSNMISHNTAMIPQDAPLTDEQIGKMPAIAVNNMARIAGGQFRHFHADEKVSLVEAEVPKLYGETFRRTVVTVDLDGRSRYIVDLFDVGGKGAQRISYHGGSTAPVVSGLTFAEQEGGSYAGADIPYEDEAYTERWCDGFNYLKDVQRAANPEKGCTVDWKCIDNQHYWEQDRDVHIKLHMLSDVEEAALAVGQPPQTKAVNPRQLAYLILKNGEGMARFANVLEPYEDASFLDHCDCRMDGDTAVITVTHKSGRVDTITAVRNGVDLHLTVESTTGYTMTYGNTVLTGEVMDFTREVSLENFITVRLSGDTTAEALTGKYIDVDTDLEPNAFYHIVGAESLGGGLWKLDVGDCTLVANFVDRMEKEKGYLYFVKEGAKVRITM